MHGSRCSHSADVEPKSSPLHPRPGHLKLSKVLGSSGWCGGDRGGESPSPAYPAALEQSPLGLVVYIIFKRRSQGLWGAKCCSGRPGSPCKPGVCNSWGASRSLPFNALGPACEIAYLLGKPKTAGFTLLPHEQGHCNLAVCRPKQDSWQGKGSTKGLLGTNLRALVHPGWTRCIVGRGGCPASSHHCPQLLRDMGVWGLSTPKEGLGSLDVQQLWRQ